MTAIHVLAGCTFAAEAESAAMTIEGNAAELTALYDALRFAAESLGAALGLNRGCPSSLLLTASLNASLAFPLGSPESESLGCILNVIGDLATAVAA